MKKISVFRLFIFIFLYSLVANFAHPITPTFIQNLELHDYMFGVAFACMSITNFVFSPFWGKVSRNFGISKVLGFCFMGYACAQLIFGWSTSELGIMIARLVGGVFISGITVNNILYVIDNSPVETRGRDLATSATINAVVAAFGFMIGGFLGDISIALTFNVQAIGLALIGLMHWFLLDDNQETMTHLPMKEVLQKSNPFQALIDAKDVITTVIICFLAVCALTTFASTCYEQCFNYFIKDQYGFPPSYNGLLKAAVGIIAFIANSTICNYLLKKTYVIKSIIPVLTICFAMMVSIVALDAVVPFIIMNVVFFGFNAVYKPLLQTSITYFNDVDNGIMVGLYNSMCALGSVGGSLLAGFIYGVHPKMSFIVSAIAFLLAVMFAYMLFKRKPVTR
ncbi:MAG: MFS transporter [Erysipelotrichaceae bacterium]|nr:MFS transporter [Erysipelotrichaceae bacterium]